MRHQRAGLAALLLVAFACGGDSALPPTVPQGTWGGEDAGLLLDATRAHVHVGCSQGDFSAPIPVGGDGSFSVEGRYKHPYEAWPIVQPVDHPAVLSGRLESGGRMVLTVTVTDGGQHYGPSLVRWGMEPAMQNCPICRLP